MPINTKSILTSVTLFCVEPQEKAPIYQIEDEKTATKADNGSMVDILTALLSFLLLIRLFPRWWFSFRSNFNPESIGGTTLKYHLRTSVAKINPRYTTSI